MQTQPATQQPYSSTIVRDRAFELAQVLVDLGDIATRENIKAELGWSDEEIDYHIAEARRVASRISTRRVA